MMIYGSRFLLMSVSGIIFMVSTSMADTASDLLSNGPIINSTLSEIVLQNGQNFTLSCKGKRPIHFTQQEIPEEVFSKFSIHQESVPSTDPEYDYEILLHLNFVDRYAIGYFACSDDTLNASDQLNNLIEEPKNSEHIAYIYIYVNGTHSLFAPMREVMTPRGMSQVVIECRPTTPDVEVTLTMNVSQSNKTPDIIKNSTKIGFLVRNNIRATYQCRGRRRGLPDEWKKNLRLTKEPPQPSISPTLEYFLKNESFSLNCTVPYESTSVVNLEWTYPATVKNTSIKEDTNRNENSNHKLIYSHILIENATEEHAGTYTCNANNNVGSKSLSRKKIMLAEPKLELIRVGSIPSIVNEGGLARLTCRVEAYPPIKENQYYYLKDNIPVGTDVTKYKLNQKPDLSDPVLTIKNVTVTDSANYTLVIFNDYPNFNKSINFELLVKAKPIVKFGKGDLKYMENTTASLLCEVMGYPLPNITWVFSNGQEHQVMKSSSIVPDSTKVYRVESRLNVPVHASGNISCKATNSMGTKNITRKLLVYEIEGGFGIKNRHQTWYAENDDVVLTCLASKYYFNNLTWYNADDEELFGMVTNRDSSFSHVAELKLPQINLTQTGENYECRGNKTDGTVISETLTLTVEARQRISILEPTKDIDEKLFPFQPYRKSCVVIGVPPPIIDWYKDDDFTKPLINDTNDIKIFLNVQNRTKVNSTIYIQNLQKEKMGKYTCKAHNDNEIQMKSFTVALQEEITTQSYTTYLVAIAVIIFTLVCLVVYLTCKVKKDKQFRRELNAAGLLYFKKGVTGSLNPELGIDEQAELLPYDDKFEFPTEKLVLGKQLGAGAFGVVYKAEARGIINAEETTPVAVKMVKKTADNMFIKALASELKIMIHMGKHMNIVNLLGACTKNVGKRELVVIVEYCKYGNIHNYMQKHREVFIDQLTDNKEKNLGKINKGFMTSSGSTGVNSDYFGSNNTQDTDHTFVNTANTNISGRKENQNQQVEFVKVSEGYVQPEWRSNYESDYSFDGRNPRPLSSRDLLCWAFQIARGMEYLASRKVLHGDLAARNILLADDNVVKICDFGLAKSIYKNDEYRTKENSPLPVKWLAIECMTDRIFSTQSDVWSYGIVLWEMFTLAKTPYPNISPRCLLQWLSDGHRLEKPTYADDRLYDVMLRCWEQKPTLRPSFSHLQELLGTFLEDNVRNHYVDLNSTYMACNVKSEGQEDYLEMVCAPDYKNLVTPSPHHYVNGTSNFFPVTPTPIDEEGYLQMSPKCNPTIFSPRAEGTTFDFEALKFNPRVSEASSGGSELTPMLTLNNLPARSGSESDHEGNASPYLKMYPRIEEDPDEVFETTQNNAKNMQNTVTNPTYITFNNEPEKIPKDIINNYINVPNGLVN